MLDVNLFIKTIRESFGASITIYTMGNCYQFYEILKVVFPTAVAYESGGHVFTKIGSKFYDIKGEYEADRYDFILLDDSKIESLCKNKMTDEDRADMRKKGEVELNSKTPNKKRIKKKNGTYIIKAYKNII